MNLFMRKTALVFVPLLLSGCNQNDATSWINENVGKSLGFKIQSTGTPANSPAPSPETAAKSEEPPLPSPDHRQVNAEFIKELFQVVLGRDVRSEDEFVKLMNVLDQGGHYDAIYNGIVYSEEYRRLEKGVAGVSALKAYAEIMTQISLDQKYDPLKIQPTEPKDVPPQSDPAKDVLPPQPTEKERTELRAQFEQEGITKPHHVLKKRLGEELLKTIDLKHEYREKLATWYGRFSVFMNKRGVSFGLDQRNKQDEYYHYKWGLNADEDRLKWECLNRVHQLMNYYAK
jgi:hypothetical protein